MVKMEDRNFSLLGSVSVIYVKEEEEQLRRYVIGFIFGMMLATATTVYAGDAIKASLFPVKYEVNGNSVEVPYGYETLNYNGRAYVPIRFVAEALDTVVIYDDKAKTIRLDDGFTLRSISSELRAGHVQTVKQGDTTNVTAQLYAGQAYWESIHYIEPGSTVEIKATISFYDEDGRAIAKIPVSASCKAEGDQIMEVEAATSADLSDYAYATLEYVDPVPFHKSLAPNILVDSSEQLAIELDSVLQDGEFTKVRFYYYLLQKGYFQLEADLNYHDENGKLLGTVHLNSEGIGTGYPITEYGNQRANLVEMVGKGDLTDAAEIEIMVRKMKRVPEILTSHEIYDILSPQNHWTKDQFEATHSFEKVVNEAAGETSYQNDEIRYTFFDHNKAITTPAVIDVYGDIPGPRGIRVGDSFDDVLSLFTQDDAWMDNESGIFNGQFDSNERPIGGTGYVTLRENGVKEITLTSEAVVPFARLFFKDDILTHYTFFMVDA